ncbi:MAG: hypothetical protein M5R42_03750 [Rhodocyclaceae bacterium]|nr:hypothetical protein [Rhodocyclaceae bacterium]
MASVITGQSSASAAIVPSSARQIGQELGPDIQQQGLAAGLVQHRFEAGLATIGQLP